MNVIITHYKKAENGIDTVYCDGKPVTMKTVVELPIRFGYSNYNEPKKVLYAGIDVDDIISIEADLMLNT
jgi:hypothetical protein